MFISGFLFVRGKNGWNSWFKHVLYMWQGFIAKNPGWSSIRELATLANASSISAVESTPRHNKYFIIL